MGDRTRFRTRRQRSWLAAFTVLITLTALAFAPSAVTANPTAFRVAFNDQLHGGIIFAQNTIVTCNGVRDNGSINEPGCNEAKTGVGPLQNNNLWRLTYIDIDDDPSTFNSSSAPLRLPDGVEVVWAGLYWGANSTGNSGNPSIPTSNISSLLLRTPAGPDYNAVTASESSIFQIRGAYQSAAVVTDLVRAGGAGEYTVANLPAALGSNQWGGWTLAVVFEDLSRPLRDITVFEGLGEIYRNVANFPLSGFRTPVQGPVDATIGIVAYEGDAGASGDYASFNGVRLASAQSPGNNYFNSRIETFGAPVTGATPELGNQFGFDVKVADATGILANGASSATVTVGSTGDQIFLGLVSTRIDLTAPRFPDIVAVQNLSGHDQTETGDLLRYKLLLSNIGDDPADEVVIRNPLPAGTSYVPGSLTIDGVSMTDTDGDDPIEILTINGVTTVVARLGTGASAQSGGRIAIGATSLITFDVTVTGAPGSTITNTAQLDYRAVTLDRAVFTPTNTVVTPVLSLPAPPPPILEPMLSLQKVAPERVPAGTELRYDLILRNTGTAVAAGVVVIDEIPTGLRVLEVSDGCNSEIDQVTCTVGALNVGATWLGSVTVLTDPATPAETRITNEAVATANPGLNGQPRATAQARTTIAGSVELSITLDPILPDPNSTDGELLITVTNNDDQPAHNVEIHVAVPDGIQLSDTEQCLIDEYLAQLSINCLLGTVPASTTLEVLIPMKLTPSHDPTAELNAVVTGSALDRVPGGNVATASIGDRPLVTLPATGFPSSLWWVLSAILFLGGGLLTRRMAIHSR